MKINIKSVLIGLLIGIIVSGTSVLALTGAVQKTLDYNNIKIVLNGQEPIPTNANGEYVEPFTIEGTTYLPVRAIASALGLEVDWDESTATVSLSENADDPTEEIPVEETPAEEVVTTTLGNTLLEAFRKMINIAEPTQGGNLTNAEVAALKHLYGMGDANAHQVLVQRYAGIAFKHAVYIVRMHAENFTDYLIGNLLHIVLLNIAHYSCNIFIVPAVFLGRHNTGAFDYNFCQNIRAQMLMIDQLLGIFLLQLEESVGQTACVFKINDIIKRNVVMKLEVSKTF